MSPVRSRSTRFSRGPRRRVTWIESSGTLTGITAGTNVVSNLVSGATYIGATIVRTHLEVQMVYAAVGDIHQLGLIVGRDTDSGFNIPDPLSDPQLDWALNKTYYATTEGATVNTNQVQHIDLKSRRKLRQIGDVYVLCLHNATTATVVYRYSCRTLIMLA